MYNDLFINIYCLLAAAWRRRYLIGIPIVALPILGFFIGIIAPKQYIANTSILIQEPAMLNPFLKDLAVETQLKKRIEGLSHLLHSRHMLDEVAKKLNLIKANTSQTKKDAIIKELSENLSAKLIGENLVELKYKGSTPESATKILTIATNVFIVRILDPQVSSLSGSEEFLEKQLAIHRKELDKAEQNLAEYKTEHADELPSFHASNVERLRQMRQLLAQKSTELAGAEAAFETMRTRLAQTNPVIGKLEENIVDVTERLAILRARYTDQHSKIQGALRELNRLKQERARLLEFSATIKEQDIDRLWQRASSITSAQDTKFQPLLLSQLQQLQVADAKVLSLKQEVNNLEQQIKAIEPRIRAFGLTERKLNELERDVKVKRELYAKLLERYEMARVTGDLGRFEQSERVKIIDLPTKPTRPATPPLILYLLAGLIAGIAIGTGLGIAAEFTDTSIRRRLRLKEITNVPVLSRIPPIADEP